jgi:UDP-4-amino-4,6-dideoxy-N-acetyl-beta-L-altrosamine N-acetyltransferase
VTTIQGRCSLRPLDEQDLRMVLDWRNQERIRAVMFTDHVISWPEHLAWYARVKEDPTQEYRIFELDDRPVGLIGVQGVGNRDGVACWAFYLGETDVPRGTGSRMEYFALELAFEELGVRKLTGEVFDFNADVLRLHKKFGFEEEGVLRRHYMKGATYRDVTVIALFAESWKAIRDEKRCLLFPDQES